jgi:hypothetical protein
MAELRNEPPADPMTKVTPEPSLAAQPITTAQQVGAVGSDISFDAFKAGDTDQLVGKKIKEVLVKGVNFLVYIGEDLTLRWRWNTSVDANSAAPIFSRVGELQAKSDFLRQTVNHTDLLNARRLIGQGLVVMFCTQNQVSANTALDTAEKFITQRGRETSRGWYSLIARFDESTKPTPTEQTAENETPKPNPTADHG